MNKKAVIFDMDGVLIDSEPCYLEMFREFLVKNHMTPDEEILKAIAGASSPQTWTYMAQMWGSPITPEELHREFRRQYPTFSVPYGTVLFPKIRELLQTLHQHGLNLSIASSSSRKAIDRMLQETELTPYFTHIVSGEMFHESKPNPEIYLHTLSLIGFLPEECIVVEDSTYGIQAAKAASLEVVARKDTRFSFDQSQADYFIEQTADLASLLHIPFTL